MIISTFFLVLFLPWISLADFQGIDHNITFLQFQEKHYEYSKTEWNELFAELKSAGFEKVILQWSWFTLEPFYWQLEQEREKAPFGKTDLDLEMHKNILQSALRYGIQIEVGLVYDENFWQMAAKSNDLLEIYLNRMYVESIAVARTFLQYFEEHPSFVGFYIPQEIDDSNWHTSERGRLLHEYFNRIHEFIIESSQRELSVSISFFSNGWVSPRHFAELIVAFFENTDVTFVYFQDGIGAQKLNINEAELYIQEILKLNPENVYVIMEIFEISGDQFLLANKKRLRKQSEMISRYTEKIISFSYVNHVLGRQETENLDLSAPAP